MVKIKTNMRAADAAARGLLPQDRYLAMVKEHGIQTARSIRVLVEVDSREVP